jgi:cobalt-zinc-cadmium efflux system membrane fusion protein
VVRQLGFNPEQIQQSGIQRSLSLVAPFAGYVRSVHANLGQYVSAQQEVITLEDPTHVHLELAVFQNDIATLKRGQRFVYQVGSDPTQFSGIIQEIGQAQSSEGHFVVHGHPDQLPESGLRTGQFIRATIQTQQAVRWALPEDAVVYKDNQPFVLRKTKNGLEFQSVRISHQENGWVGFDDLAKGTYVVKQAHLLVQPEEAE